MSLADIRREYLGQPLDETDSDPDPLRQFARWFEQVRALEPDPTAMSLATATRDGRPSVRIVLLKGVDAGGFVFYTSHVSRKAREMEDNGRASLLFFWRSLERQVRISGSVARVSEADADAYFATRPLDSRLSVHASEQSAVIESRAALESRFEAARQKYGENVPRPSSWGGYRVTPDEMEFWQGRESRLHDRLLYSRPSAVAGRQPDEGGWLRRRLAP